MACRFPRGSHLRSLLPRTTLLAPHQQAIGAAPGPRPFLPLASATSPIGKKEPSRPFCSTAPPRSGSSSTPAYSPQSDESHVSALVSARAKLASQGYTNEASMWEQRVCWGDHDQFGHVNNVHYVRWFESQRMRFAEVLAGAFADQRRTEILKGTGKSFILASINVKYRRPVVYPDTILIASQIVPDLQADRFILRAAAYSLAQQTTVAISDQLCVTYDYPNLRKCDIPDDIRLKLEESIAESQQGKGN